MNRRSWLRTAAGILVAPAIVRAESIMRVRPVLPGPVAGLPYELTTTVGVDQGSMLVWTMRDGVGRVIGTGSAPVSMGSIAVSFPKDKPGWSNYSIMVQSMRDGRVMEE